MNMMIAPCTINDLPDDVLLEVFTLLPLHTLRCVVPLVCKRWKEIALSSAVWYSYGYVNFLNKPSCVKNWTCLLAFLKSTPVRHLALNLYCLPTFSKELFMACPQLKSLQLEGVDYSHQNFKVIQNQWCIVVKHLGHSHFCRAHELCNADHGTYLKNLHKLFPNVERLDIDVMWHKKSFYNMVKIKKMCELKQLKVNSSICSLEVINDLMNLPLSRVMLEDKRPSLEKLLLLIKFPLYSINLDEDYKANVLPAAHIHSFFSNPFPHLVVIKLNRSRIDDQGALSIRKNCCVLRVIEISVANGLNEENQISSIGLRHLLHLPSLQDIEISFPRKNDWCFKRHKRSQHLDCDPSEPCPLDDQLLDDWCEVPLDTTH